VDIKSDVDMPPFDKATMDGYAFKKSDQDQLLKIIDTVAAGDIPENRIGAGECAKIMTGAMVPEGADSVVRREFTVIKEDLVKIINPDKTNIAYKAEDVKIGDVVLKQGNRLRPQEISMLASVGCVNVPVSVMPKVGVIATGTEIIEPENKPGPGQIRNSNSIQLLSQISRAGGDPVYYGIVEDEKESLDRIIKKGLEECDILLLSGGVSMGDYDYVPEILEKNGVNILFNKVAVQPGNPTTFGRRDNTFVFGLPGNPVSTLVIFELFVKPFINLIMGEIPGPANVKAKVIKDITRKKAKRRSFFPVILREDGSVEKLEYHGSAHMLALCRANGIASFDKGQTLIKAGEMIDVRPV
jgi:molybdopterin molybdotransferase